MSRDQLIFRSMFENQFFGPRNGFEFRDWQGECGDDYAEDVHRFRDSFGTKIQHRYLVVGGTGSGKTKCVAGLASFLLNTRLVDQMVFVCPNRSIRRKAQKDLKHFFNIDLRVFHKKKHEDGIPREVQGYILTYAHLMQDLTLHRRICSRTPTLVVFDEIHHLGDEGVWGQCAEEAFGKVPFVIGLSGTPFRSDNRRIPFVTYEEKPDGSGLLCFKGDSPYGYTYSFGRAVADSVCRKPIFLFSRGIVEIRIGTDSGSRVVSFEDKISDDLSALRLRGAVKYGTATRRQMLAEALGRCKEENRKVIIFLGGDTEGDQTPTEDAKNLLPKELAELGIDPSEFEIVTGDDTEAHQKIDAFGQSDKWILISINMVSEGVDIPELSAAIFLSSITSMQTTLQRLGRAARRRGEDDPHPDMLVFMFAHPPFMELAEKIEDIVSHEISLNRAKRPERDGTEGGTEHRSRAESMGIEGGEIVILKVKDLSVPMPVVEAAKAELRTLGLPTSLLHAYLLILRKGQS